MIDDDDIAVIVCAPYSVLQFYALEGNTLATCEFCKGPVVLSREGRAFANTRPHKISCDVCAAREEPDQVPDAVPGALERLERLGLDHSERFRKMTDGRRMGELFDDA